VTKPTTSRRCFLFHDRKRLKLPEFVMRHSKRVAAETAVCRQSYRPKNEPNHRNQLSTFAASMPPSISEEALFKQSHGMRKSAIAMSGMSSPDIATHPHGC